VVRLPSITLFFLNGDPANLGRIDGIATITGQPTMSKKVPKKRAGDTAARRQKTGVKRRRDGRFATGNSIGESSRFRAGGPPGPGRPPNLGSPRAQLKRYAEQIAPEKLRRRIQQQLPDLNVEEISWAESVAIAHLIEAASGNMAAIALVFRQVDDSGAATADGRLEVSGEVGGSLSIEAARRIAQNFDKRHQSREE